MKDYYRILNVSETASEEQIKKAYRRLAKECHPDAAGDDPQKEQRMYELQEAYEILGDAEKKKAYDSKRNSFSEKKQAKKQEDSPQDSQDISDAGAFERFFGFQPGKGMETYQHKKKEPGKQNGSMKPEERFASFFEHIR